MSNRIFHALGTASQVPTRKRNHNGYFLRWDEEGFLFDPGEGTQRQMIFAGVAASEITKIFITHFHGDHCLGLPGILQRLSLDRITHTVEVYFPASGKKYFHNLRDASIYHKTAKIKPIPIESDGVIFSGPKFTIETRRLDHTVDSYGYRFVEPDSVTMDKERLAALGLSGPLVGRLKSSGSVEHEGRTIRVEDVSTPRKGGSFAFVMDTRYCQAAVDLARDVDTLVAESTYLNEHQKEATSHGHMTTTDAANIAREAGAKLLILTHFSQRYGEYADFKGEARRVFKNARAMRDGDSVDLRERREKTG